ncbi:synapse differentiation-inducing gene protein 1-like isoform X2 [Halichondria panicea]|uniref:synapse differentiation-inducing gene protein 1-like isoform X2 n=1 Tax=Halichondria panicea TaxID=6063 RepID=UPI00312BCBD4
MEERPMLYDSLSEEDGQPPPYTDQPKASSKSSKVHKFSLDQSPAVKMQDAPLSTIYVGLFATICCIWPCGLVAVIIGLQALQAYYRGDLHESRRKNTISKRFTITSVVLGIVLIIACLALFVMEFIAITNLPKSTGQSRPISIS